MVLYIELIPYCGDEPWEVFPDTDASSHKTPFDLIRYYLSVLKLLHQFFLFVLFS